MLVHWESKSAILRHFESTFGEFLSIGQITMLQWWMVLMCKPYLLFSLVLSLDPGVSE